MNYEEKYKETYDKALEYKALNLRESVEADAADQLLGFGGPFISEEEYEDTILPFWDKYGIKPKKFWFDIFGSRDHLIEPRFIPTDLYFNEILPQINNLQIYLASKDKCMFERYLPEIRQPETVCKRMSGFYYDAGMNMISRGEAIKLCLGHEGRLVLKPASGASSRNIHSADPAVCSEKDIEALFDLLGANFIVQHRIEQHPELARLNPDTVNTIRVNSVLTEDGVYIPHSIIKVGEPGQQILHQGSGGWDCEIENDNTLNKKVNVVKPVPYVNEDGVMCEKFTIRWQDVPERFGADSGYKIPYMDRVRDVARTAHMKLPHFRWLGWDFTVDEDGEPVVLEYNLAPGPINGQIATCKPMFGEMTEEFLDDCFIHGRIEKNQLRI